MGSIRGQPFILFIKRFAVGQVPINGALMESQLSNSLNYRGSRYFGPKSYLGYMFCDLLCGISCQGVCIFLCLIVGVVHHIAESGCVVTPYDLGLFYINGRGKGQVQL